MNKKNLCITLTALVVVALAIIAVGIWAPKRSRHYETVNNDPMKARIYTLPNGLKVYLTKNAEKPEIQTFIVVKAGGQQDPLESTGLAHYEEHLMFKGTSQYGTTDYEAEKPNLQAIDSLYELYGQTTDAAERKAIYHLIDSFSYESSKIAIANEFDKMMDGIGATRLNAYTSNDRTCYHEVIPSGELRRWAMIESGRFKDLVIRGFHTELEAVYEEYNMRSSNDQGKVLLAINNILYPDIPYRQHEVIGTPEHLKNPSLINIKKFYNTYYRPNNVAICLSGDLDFDHAMDIIEEYFGDWEPNENLPKFSIPEQAPLAAAKDTVVYGQEAPMTWLGWTFPALNHEDMDVVTIIDAILQNGKVGFFDQLMQQQQILDAGEFCYPGNDYSTYLLIGIPKEGQSLKEVKDLMLAQVERLKAGDFSDELLTAIINNARKDQMVSLQSNNARDNVFLQSFIYDIPYADLVHEVDRLADITKDDVVRVANKYFTDKYACVYKEQSAKMNAVKVDKPIITPIEMNRDKSSEFCQNLLAMQAERLTPQFLDFEKDLNQSTLAKGQQLLSRQNKENELFTLSFIINKGHNQAPELSMAESMMQYLGTGEMSAMELQMQLYALASDMRISVNADHTVLTISGLQENLQPTLNLLEAWLLTAQPDEAIYQELVRDALQAHELNKKDQDACFSALTDCGLDGFDAVRRTTLTPAQMKALSSEQLLAELRALVPAISRVTYFGPATEKDITKLLDACRLIELGEAEARLEEAPIAHQQVDKTEVWIAPYDAPAVYLMSYANWGEVYDMKDEAIIRLFNEYFSGSMGAVVFQEMREARSLAYHASARYSMPEYKGQNNIFYTFIISQNDKLQDCVETFRQICNELPISESAFEQAKASLMKGIEQRRYVRAAPINAYIGFERQGWDHDYYQDLYEIIPTITMDDMVAFQKEHVANRTYRHLLLGNPKDLDMNYLKTLGPVRQLTLEDIFIY